MFCNQCEQTAGGTGCTRTGVCGKDDQVAVLQDLLIHSLKGLSLYAHSGRQVGVNDPQVNRFTVFALFSTLTNVDFDPRRFHEYLYKSYALTKQLQQKVAAAGGKTQFDHPAARFTERELELPAEQGRDVGPGSAQDAPPDIQSLQQILVYGLKGIAAYAEHAAILGQEDDTIYAFLHEALAALTDSSLDSDDWLKMVLRCGEVNLRAMEILDAANTGTFGHPVPTAVPLGHRRGKCLLVSGHDLKDLHDILQQTEGKGIDVYTHGEMLPAHGYPGLKKYKHFYGHYGTAWQNQRKEFAAFPGAIVMTTNCLQKPAPSYADNIFTTGPVGWPGVPHLSGGDFSPAIERALALPGFSDDLDQGSVNVGFARNTVMSVADKVIEGVKSGAIKHFLLVGGCDGAKSQRSYYTELVEKAPDDTVILTLGCGKFRFFDKQLDDIGGIPRLLDIGQCNDAYSAIQIAVALAKAFACDVNDLPLSLVLSWYEQKAVAILLTLLHLGIKGIRIGPSLPAFITPNILQVLVQKFDLQPITTAGEDLAAILGR